MENIYNPVNLDYTDAISYSIAIHAIINGKIIHSGIAKIEKCIESCTNGAHLDGCINMVESFTRIVKKISPNNYYDIKLNLIEKIVNKSKELINVTNM